MSYLSMSTELTGMLPRMPFNYAQTVVNRALQDVYRQSLWSFQLFESNWTSPNNVNAGTATVTQGQDTVTVDATAAAAINAIGLFPSAVTQRQFRIGINTIYNIWGWDGTSVLTLDRNYQETSASTIGYNIFQVYYPSPVEDFKSWITVRDIVNYNDLILSRTRGWVDEQDPQRSIVYIPTHCVPYQPDQNPASPTSGWLLWELWGQPSYQLVYQLYGTRKGTALVNPTDTVPQQIGEDCVMALARYYAYEWGEANREQGGKIGNFIRLKDDAMKQYRSLFKQYRMQDRAAVDNFMTRCRTAGRDGRYNTSEPYYNAVGGTAYPGSPW